MRISSKNHSRLRIRRRFSRAARPGPQSFNRNHTSSDPTNLALGLLNLVLLLRQENAWPKVGVQRPDVVPIDFVWGMVRLTSADELLQALDGQMRRSSHMSPHRARPIPLP